MDFKKSLLNGFKLNMAYTIVLVKDVPEEKLTEQPQDFINHPAWTIGHLCTALQICFKVLGKEYTLDENWISIFKRKGPGDPRLPDPNKSKYPTKKELVKTLNEMGNELIQLIENANDALLKEDYQWKFNNYLSTKGEFLHFILSIHHSWHIGQLAEWRRMMGYESALARLHHLNDSK